MRISDWKIWLALVWIVVSTPLAAAQTITGSSISHKSSGSGSGNWTLNENGYVGTYFSLAAPGSVTLTVNASGSTNDAVSPRMNLVVADTKIGFDVAVGFNNYQHTFDLPAGTHFVRTEYNNDVPSASRQLTIGSLNIAGATSVSNTTTQSTNNLNALVAADTYIENFRKGPARVVLSGAAPGAEVHVKLTQHDFRFGTAVGGTTLNGVNSYLNNANYSSFLLDHFNTVTQGNAGKWQYNEGTRDQITMNAVDRVFQFAEDNDLQVRLHNMLWADSQQPNWVNTLLNNASGGNITAENDLRAEISERIDYYVGNSDGNPVDDRALRYVELDVLNEHVHQPKYWNVYGAEGISGMFSEVASAVTAAGAGTKLYLNEYNVLQYGGDNYGNWYRQDVEEISNYGGAISGIGVQYYPFHVGDSNAHSPARIQQIFQNLSVAGLPISLTEFGVQTSNGTTVSQAATYLQETMRMVFGTPNATTFVIWGFWANDIWNQAPLAALMDANWNLTEAGAAYDALMAEWDTDLTLNVGPDGTIDFGGFYGLYEITVDGQTFELDVTKGQSIYSLAVAAGDYNGDGTVDSIDYTIWRDTLGSTDDLRADGNGNHMIDEGDYALWKSLFGTTYPGSGQVSFAVPEPASAVLVLTAAAISARRLCTRTNRSRRAS